MYAILTRFLLAIFVILSMSPAAMAQDATTQKHVLLRVLPDVNAAIPGQPVRLALEQTITPGWHTYWVNSGDSGEAMRIKWDLPQGVKAQDILWPAPDRIPYGPLMNFGYSDHAVMLTELDIPANARVGDTLDIKGEATILVCDEICIPETHDIHLSLPVAATQKPINETLFADAVSKMPVVLDWKTHTEYGADDVRVRITVPAAETSKISKVINDIIWFPLEWGLVENSTDQFATFEPTTSTLTLRQQRAEMPRDISKIKNAAYLVRLPEAAFVVGGTIASANAPTMFEGQPTVAPQNTNLMIIFIFAFLGGIILNIMPCVFPVLSMKALHLVSLPREERAAARMQGIFYAAGVISTFLALAAVMFIIRAAGAQMGWGFQLQNPAVVAGLAWLMFVIGLNLAGTFDLRVAFGGDILRESRHHPLFSSFLTGIVATLVATPCSAPFMATAMGAALVQPAAIAMLIFALVGVGLAFPYVLLCFVPMLQRLLPRPGAWMQSFRGFLAFPMYATAVWLVWVVAQQGGAHAVGVALGGMVAIAFAIWLFGRTPARAVTRHILTALGLIVLALCAYSLAHITPERPDSRESATAYFKPFDAKSFENAIRTTNDPVFVNMTASWCITCLVNEKAVLNTDAVRTLFADNNVAYFKGDWTNRDESITAFLEQYGRTGVPLYVYFGPADETGTRPSGIVLPQILSTDEIRSLMPQ